MADSTRTRTSFEIAGKRLAPGEYDLFVDLKEPAWTLIVSTQPTQDKYDPNEKTKIWGATARRAKAPAGKSLLFALSTSFSPSSTSKRSR